MEKCKICKGRVRRIRKTSFSKGKRFCEYDPEHDWKDTKNRRMRK